MHLALLCCMLLALFTASSVPRGAAYTGPSPKAPHVVISQAKRRDLQQADPDTEYAKAVLAAAYGIDQQLAAQLGLSGQTRLGQPQPSSSPAAADPQSPTTQAHLSPETAQEIAKYADIARAQLYGSTPLPSLNNQGLEPSAGGAKVVAPTPSPEAQVPQAQSQTAAPTQACGIGSTCAAVLGPVLGLVGALLTAAVSYIIARGKKVEPDTVTAASASGGSSTAAPAAPSQPDYHAPRHPGPINITFSPNISQIMGSGVHHNVAGGSGNAVQQAG